MGVQCQELYICRTDADRGRCHRELRFFRDESRRLLSALQLYRCYVVWKSKLVLILPMLLWCAAGGRCATHFRIDRNNLWDVRSNWIHVFCDRTARDAKWCFRWGSPALDCFVLGNGFGNQPVNDSYVITFSWMSVPEFVSPFTSSVGLSYLVCRPQDCQDTLPPTIAIAADFTHPR